MTTEIGIVTEDEFHIVGVQNDPEEDCLLWQRGKVETAVHFEWNGQANSGYDIVEECSLDRDGIHIVLSDGRLVYFYFRAIRGSLFQHEGEGPAQARLSTL